MFVKNQAFCGKGMEIGMREFLVKLFEKSHFNTGIMVTPLSVAHIVYMVLILGSVAALYFAFRGKGQEKAKKLLDFLAVALVFSYLSDFFIHDLMSGGEGLNMDKLPFHVCTVLCPLVAFVQFGKHGHRIKTPVTLFAVIAPLMYLGFPASIGEGEPWCYQAVQTMFYHGVLFAYGILNLALGQVKPQIKKCWHSAIFISCITLWAKLGNLVYSIPGREYSWFFLEEDAFYIGLVENYGMPKFLLMIINPCVFFLAVFFVYLICHLVQKRSAKKEASIAPVDTKKAKEAEKETV